MADRGSLKPHPSDQVCSLEDRPTSEETTGLDLLSASQKGVMVTLGFANHSTLCPPLPGVP